VWNRNQRRCKPLVDMGAYTHASPHEAVQEADIVITMLRDDQASRAVWLDENNGALAGMTDDTIAIECSTLSLGWCEQLSQHMASQRINFLDAPVVGSRPQAEACQLIHLVGGDTAVLQQVQAILETNASTIHHIGASGRGMAMKLAVNAHFGIQVAALGELLGFLTRQGMDISAASALIGELPVTSPAARAAATAMASDNFAPLFPIELVRKDLGYAIAATPASALPLTANALALFTLAIQHGYGSENINAVTKLFNSIP